MGLRLLDRLNAHATHAPDAPAVRHVNSHVASGLAKAISHGDLRRHAWGMAGRLSRDVPAGEVVMLACPNDARFTISFLAILAAGCKAFPVSTELAGPELLGAFEQASVAAVVGTDAVISVLRPMARTVIPICEATAHGSESAPAGRDPGWGGLLLQSSGTTGRPKIAFRSAASLDAVAGAMCEAIGFAPADRVLLPLPLCHSYGVEHGLLAPVTAGSCVHLCQGFDLGLVLKELTEGGITIFPGVPFMFESLARTGAAPMKLGTLRRAYSAGGPLPAAVFEAFRARYGVPVSQLYGATEIGSVTFNGPEGPGAFNPASVGRPMRGVEVRILGIDDSLSGAPLPAGAEGQVAVRAASMMSGYVRDESDSPLVDGYFLTGDLGRLDGQGRLTLTGRIKLLIDVGGLKVNPMEVEEVISQHPDVAACVVLPVRVSETVCRLKAVVQPRQPDGPGPSPESLRRFARDRLTPYKVPRVFEVRKTLPRSPTGKILRHMVAA